MKQDYQKTGGYARKPRGTARQTITKILKSQSLPRPFDPVAYAAALEVIG